MYMGSESMHFPPPSPIKPQHLASLDVFPCRDDLREKKKSSEVRPDKEHNRHGGDRRAKQQYRPQRPTGCMDMLTNLLGCRGSETIDSSVLVPVARADGGGTHKRRGREGDHGNFRKSRGSDRGEKKVPSTIAKYKPVGAPNCSQCGRRFNPEKLHLHMKSCKALKARVKGRSSFVEAATFGTESNRTSEPSSQEFSRESIAGLLT